MHESRMNMGGGGGYGGWSETRNEECGRAKAGKSVFGHGNLREREIAREHCCASRLAPLTQNPRTPYVDTRVGP